jgi:hypothetical protein
MRKPISRRDFMQFSGLSAAALAFKPPPPISGMNPEGLARVATTKIGLYAEPSFRADVLAFIGRDNLLPILSRETSDEGPPHNPIWYRVPEGYIHSGNIQQVEWHLQDPRWDTPETGAVFEVTVPFSRAYQTPDPEGLPLYRLYYQSNAWATKLVKGEDGRYWYLLVDDLLNLEYYARAEHLRRVEPEELSPISADVPHSEKRIEVSLSNQELIAYERDKIVFRTRISSGIPSSKPGDNGIPTATPKGHFYVDKKMPLRHMGDGRLTANLEAYELPGVPWVSYFHLTGVAFHGTYWHCDYGRPRSHGCVNMRPEEANWIYRWTEPVTDVDTLLQTGYGTKVLVY